VACMGDIRNTHNILIGTRPKHEWRDVITGLKETGCADVGGLTALRIWSIGGTGP
jgi:hypothetical protein